MPRKFDAQKVYDGAVARFLATMNEVDHHLKASELTVQAHEQAKWLVEEKVKYFEDWVEWRRSLPDEKSSLTGEDERYDPITFNIVELDVGDKKHSNWAKLSPSKDAAEHGEDVMPDGAKDEKRSYVELAGGQLLAWFVVDPRIVNGELFYKKTDSWGRPNPDFDKTPLWLVCHWPKNPVDDDPENFLGQAIHEEGCSGYGYIPFEMTPKEIKKLRLVRTIEASDPAWAGCAVREDEDEKLRKSMGLDEYDERCVSAYW